MDLGVRPGPFAALLDYRLYYPERSPGPLPVIIFSPGAGASPQDYGLLDSFWASHGYVVIQPAHRDFVESHALEVLGADELGYDSLLSRLVRDPKLWDDRADDVDTLIDGLPSLANGTPELENKIEIDDVGVGGHSFGAQTAMLAGGAALDAPGWPKSARYGRSSIKAILAMSPDGVGELGLTAHSWERLDLPMMIASGGRDRGPGGQSPAWRLDGYRLSPPGDKYAVLVRSADHLSFTGPENARGSDATFDEIEVVTLAFWDAYLKHDAAARAFLQPRGLSDCSSGDIQLSAK